MIAKDSSKRRLHIGKHIIKFLRNISEAPISTNIVIVFLSSILATHFLIHRLVICHVEHAASQRLLEPVP